MVKRSRRQAELGSRTGTDWYARYRLLQNRHDQLREQGRSLPADEEAERLRLLDRLLQEANQSTPPVPSSGPRELPYTPGLGPPAPTPASEIRYTPGLEPPSCR